MGTITTPQGAFPLLWFLTTSLNLRDSQSVKPKAFRKRLCMYVSRPPVTTQSPLLTVGHLSQRAFSIQKGHCKFSKLFATLQIFEKEISKTVLSHCIATLFI